MNGGGDWLFKQFSHALAGDLSCHPSAHPFAYLALFDSVVVPHKFSQGIQESSESCHIQPPRLYYLPHIEGVATSNGVPLSNSFAESVLPLTSVHYPLDPVCIILPEFQFWNA